MFFDPSAAINDLSANISSTPASCPANALAVTGPHLAGNGREGFSPGDRLETARDAHIRLVEPLRAQTVDYVTRLVGNPLLVHVFIGARQDPHHFAAARINADR